MCSIRYQDRKGFHASKIESLINPVEPNELSGYFKFILGSAQMSNNPKPSKSFNPGDSTDSSADAMLVDWKQGNQSYHFNGAKMPNEKNHPSGFEPFAKNHAFEITTKRWQYDVKSLIAALNDVAGAKWKRKARYTAGGTGAIAGATGANALLSVLGAAGLKTTIPVFLATWPTAIIAGGGIAGYLTYKGVKRLLNKI